MADPRERELTRLGLYGLAPFALGVVAVWAPPAVFPGGLAYDLGETTLLYAALTATWFAGAGAGGLLMSGPRTSEPLAPAMIAVLVAWVAVWPVGAFMLSLPDIARYLMAIGAHLYLLLRDLRAVGEGALPFWYGALRKRLAFWISIALALIACRYLL